VLERILVEDQRDDLVRRKSAARHAHRFAGVVIGLVAGDPRQPFGWRGRSRTGGGSMRDRAAVWGAAEISTVPSTRDAAPWP